MKINALLLLVLTGMVLSGCVHREFGYPSSDALPVEVDLEIEYFDKEMPLHTVVDYDKTRAGVGESFVSRHIVKVYDCNRAEVASVILTDEASSATVSRRHTFNLVPGKYIAVCWTDYTEGNDADCHYDTSAFPAVELRCTADDDGFLVHRGSSIWRDAFCGSRNFSVCDGGRILYDDGDADRVVIEMRRPMARFLFEAVDFEDFAETHGVSASADGESSDLLSCYNITFRYDDYMPSVFSVQTDSPIDSRVGASFEGEPRHVSSGSGAIEIGSDFVFVHPLETFVKVAVEVKNTDTGELVARAGPFMVPLLRNRLTIVRGRFLTSQLGSGIVLDTGFDGEYNIEIK